MNVHDLYAAIGQADERYVAHSERSVTRGRQLGLRACMSLGLAVLVLVSALSITAAASPAFREWLFGIAALHDAPVARPVALEGEDFGVFSEGKLEIRPEVELKEGFPTSIETFYVPMLLAESWEPGIICTQDPESYLAALREQCFLYWDDPQADPPRSVCFSQFTGRYLELGTPLTWIDLGYHMEDTGYRIEAVELEGIPMQRIRVEASSAQLEHGFASSSGGDYYFWTDGSYIFSLAVPLGTQEQFVAEAAASLAPVEDLSPYLELRPDEGLTPEDPPLSTRYTPGWLPEGWVQLDTSREQQPWLAACAWEKEGVGHSILTMIQTTQDSFAASEELSWLQGMEEYQSAALEIGGAEARLYENESRVQLILSLTDSALVLESFGPEKLSAETLVQIAEQLIAEE